MVRKVNFLIVGTQKGGTTALCTFLASHPQICMPENIKEVHFFDRGRYFLKKRPDYKKYHKHFKESPDYIATGEATPIYMYWSKAVRRIKQYNPSMKFIFILRNPVDRAYSQYIMERRRFKEYLPFCIAIRIEKCRRYLRLRRQHRIFSYVDRGFYSRQIVSFMHRFPRNQMLFLKNEELMNEHKLTLDKVYGFLGVEKGIYPKQSIVFSYSYGSMSLRDHLFLLNKYKQDLAELEKLTGLDCSDWMKV